MTWLAGYALAGALIGFVAGLLGVGGGMMLVPIMVALFGAQGFVEGHLVHLALGTAMASIVFTSGASVREHHKLGAVDWAIFKRMTPGMVTGTLLATAASGLVPQRELAIAFAVIVVGASIQMFFGKKPKAERTLPGPLPLFLVGTVIGVIAGLVSAGGAFVAMPFLLFCGVRAIVAIGTAAALSVPVAVMGTVGYAIAGWNVAGLPPYSVGFVYVPALAAIVCTSVFTAPYGARLAHRLPVQVLKRCFAVLLLCLAGRMLYTFW